jgi:lipopolysaccharide assembly protein A
MPFFFWIEGEESMRILFWILTSLILVFGIVFACLNAQTVLVNFLVWKITFPLSMLIVTTFIFGCIIGWLASFIIILKQKSLNMRLQRKLASLEPKIELQRGSPIKSNL